MDARCPTVNEKNCFDKWPQDALKNLLIEPRKKGEERNPQLSCVDSNMNKNLLSFGDKSLMYRNWQSETRACYELDRVKPIKSQAQLIH